MTRAEHPGPGGLSRREALAYTAALGGTFLAAQGLAGEASTASR